MFPQSHEGFLPHPLKSYACCLLAFGLTLLSINGLRGEIRVDYDPIQGDNMCLPDAVGFQTALQVQYPGTWSRILRLDWNVKRNGQKFGHAYCIYESNNRLYAYDSRSGQRSLPLEPAAKLQPQTLGKYLGRGYYASAAFLPAFDPPRSMVKRKSASPAGAVDVASNR